jgi:hypothetical protein
VRLSTCNAERTYRAGRQNYADREGWPDPQPVKDKAGAENRHLKIPDIDVKTYAIKLNQVV